MFLFFLIFMCAVFMIFSEFIYENVWTSEGDQRTMEVVLRPSEFPHYLLGVKGGNLIMKVGRQKIALMRAEKETPSSDVGICKLLAIERASRFQQMAKTKRRTCTFRPCKFRMSFY